MQERIAAACMRILFGATLSQIGFRDSALMLSGDAPTPIFTPTPKRQGTRMKQIVLLHLCTLSYEDNNNGQAMRGMPRA
jgi:hypothetical protein